MTSPSLSLGLFDAVSSLPAHALARALRERDVIAPVDPGPLDLAHLLAAREAVINQLGCLSRDELNWLDQLASGHPAPEGSQLTEATDRLLTTPAGELRPELAEIWPEVRSSVTATAAAPDRRFTEVVVFEPAVMVASAEGIETLIQSVQRQPMAAQAAHDASAWGKRLNRDDSLETTLALVDIAQRAGLIGIDGDHLVVTRRGETYTRQPLRRRLLEVAQSLWNQLPSWWLEASARTINETPSAQWDWPLVGVEQWDSWLERCRLVGLAAAGQPTVLASAFHQGDDGRAVIDAALPDSSDQLYPDGPDSVVAAGVLSDQREEFLRRIARWHSGGLAARFVVSASSVVSALQSGVPADEIRRFVAEAIPGGADSPLAHLVDETIEKSQSLGLQSSDSGSELQIADEMTRQLLLSDRRLAPLGLAAGEGSTLHSQLPVDQVRELLIAEGYPVLVRSPGGGLVQPTGTNAPECAAIGAGWVEDDTAALIARWEGLKQSAPDEWFEPVIGLAIETGGPVELTVDTGQAQMAMELELRSVGNGRLRARDIRSDVERTIPVNRIVSMSPRPVSSSQS